MNATGDEVPCLEAALPSRSKVDLESHETHEGEQELEGWEAEGLMVGWASPAKSI